MLAVVANKTEAIVSDDRRKIYMNVTREEAKRITLGKACVWKDREVLYRTRDYYIEIGFKLVDSMEKEKRIERMYNYEIGYVNGEGGVSYVSGRNVTLDQFQEEYGKYDDIVFVGLVVRKGGEE